MSRLPEEIATSVAMMPIITTAVAIVIISAFLVDALMMVPFVNLAYNSIAFSQA